MGSVAIQSQNLLLSDVMLHASCLFVLLKTPGVPAYFRTIREDIAIEWSD
jgi:hypothetical protein